MSDQGDATAVIIDRGYRPYTGERRGTLGAMGAIILDGFRRVLGIRRKARTKIYPWALIALMMMTAVIIASIAFFARGIEIDLPGNGEYFDFTSFVAMLFVALAGPQLLVPDRTQGVLSVYLSRPLGMRHYLGAKILALFLIMMAFYLTPQVLLHLSLATLSPDGFGTYLADHMGILADVGATALAYFVLHASLVVALSAVIPRIGFVAGAYLGILTIVNGLVEELVNQASFEGSRWLALLALEQHPRVVRDWLFDIDTVLYVPEAAGFEPWVSLAAIGAMAVVAAVVVWSQYRKLP